MSMNEQEAKDPCIGQEKCEDCPRYMDDCDGKEETKMNSLLILGGDIGELNEEQKVAWEQVEKTFNNIIKHNKDVVEILNCEFCMEKEDD